MEELFTFFLNIKSLYCAGWSSAFLGGMENKIYISIEMEIKKKE